MDFIRNWLLGIAGAAILGAAALAVTPPGAVRKTAELGAALLLAVMALRPLTGWDGTIGSELPFEREAFVQTPEKTGTDFIRVLIEERTAAYIVNKAQAVGLNISVSAECRSGAGYPEPWAVTVRHPRPEHARNALESVIADDLGIPPERQAYVE